VRTLDTNVPSDIAGKLRSCAPSLKPRYDPQTRRELFDVARNYEILAMSIELLPPDRSA
jgi:hypothetical protein